ncbi:MAG TPA: family 16 glycoside hydrolase, partial [Planctomycetota bacterium]|nr:family 16 glycoside hydrolase [Planctomycetota bacterium]
TRSAMRHRVALSSLAFSALGAIAFVISGCGEPPPPRVADASTPQLPLASGPVTAAFDGDVVDKPPAGFTVHTIGPGRPSQWLVKKVVDAPSGSQVLMQCDDDDTNNRFPCVLSNAGRYGDVRVEVKGKGISGNRDRSFGVIARAIDEKNYYVARCNTVNENVRLYVLIDGKRTELAEWEGSAAPGVWHSIALEVKGDHLTVFFNGKKVIEKQDGTLPGAGRVGLWTKAEAVSQFDDFKAAALP